MDFELVGPIEQIETFATGRSIRELPRLRKVYGRGRWRKRKGVATVRLADGSERLGRGTLVRSNGYWPQGTEDQALEKRKIYEVLPDFEAAKHDQIRVIDESGEDYLYPERFFAEIDLPQPLRRALTASV
jgi:hypothetical protein